MQKNRLEEILNAFRDVRVGVIGDMMLDDYIIGTVERISPEAPVPVVSVKEEKFVLGGAANVVNNLSVLGAQVFCFGVIGNDFDGDRLLNEFKKQKIEVSGIVRSEKRRTIVKRRIIGESQQLLRLDWEDAKPISEDIEELLIVKIMKKIEGLDAIILSDYDKGILTYKLVREIIKICKEKNIKVMVDPKPKNAENYIGATAMTPNRKEALECLGRKSFENIVDIGKELKEKLHLESLLLTRSEEGVSLFEKDEVINIPTYAKEVFDVTGAGDTVISVFTLAASVKNVTLCEAAKIANTAAGVVVGKIGTSTVTKEEILEFYNRIYKEWV